MLPIALAFGRLGLTPNALTVIGFGISVGAGVAAAAGAWIAAGALVIVGGVFDLFDGALARATNRASRVGAFLDSVFDRAGEAVVYIGIVAGSLAAGFGTGALLAVGALASSLMVSYTRAKSESLGFTPGTGMANVGLAPREVRLVLLTIGLILTGWLGGLGLVDSGFPGDSWQKGAAVLATTLGLITVLATITTIQRIVHVIRQSATEEHA
jgi:CDP-diacylglycerol--glycerol-3-phosphate 3-phosphatidyltransferase